jgi:hypothetical protein
LGVQKIVGFAGALALEPTVMLHDEPSAGLSQCPLWVNRVVSAVGRRLPVFPRGRTSSRPVGMSQTCQKSNLREGMATFGAKRPYGKIKCRSLDHRSDDLRTIKWPQEFVALHSTSSAVASSVGGTASPGVLAGLILPEQHATGTPPQCERCCGIWSLSVRSGHSYGKLHLVTDEE